MKILLHTCCAPCLVEPGEVLRAEGLEVVPYFYNPNIHPYTEWERRRDTLSEYVLANGFDARIVDDYGLDDFLAGVAADPRRPARCSVCYRMRLDRSAEYARAIGADSFGTTLCVSPYQDHAVLRAEGDRAAAKHGVAFLYRDFRPYFREGQKRAKELGLYRQGYCGCIYSERDRYQKQSGR